MSEFQKEMDMVFDEDTWWAAAVAAVSSFWGLVVSVDWIVILPAALGVIYLVMKIVCVTYELKKNKQDLTNSQNNQK